MKKRLFDLSVQEFTYLLLDFEQVYEIEVKLISDDNSPLAVYEIGETREVNYEKSDKADLVKGTYSQLYSVSAGFPEMRRWIVENLFDYDMPVESIDVYNYLEYKTGGFNEDKIKIVLNEMEMYYTLEYRDEMYCRAREKYIREGKAIPQIKINNKLTHYQDEYLDDEDAMIKEMLGPGAEFFYHMAIGLLKSKIKSGTALDRQNTTPQGLDVPSELDTPRAREYFQKAEEAGFIAKTSTGYKWTLNAGRGALSQLAYFCSRVYCPDNVGELPETALNKLFGVSRIGAALTQVNNAKQPQKWRIEIDRIFED